MQAQMMKILMIITIILWKNTVFGQSKKEIRKAGVKSLTEVITDIQNGKEIVHKDVIRKFDKNGETIDETEFDKTGKIRKRSLTKYNNLNDKIEEIVLDEKGKQIERTFFRYDSKGEKSEEYLFNEKNELLTKSVFEVNNKGLKTERKTFDAKGTLIQHKKYIYEL
jgi:hypothetical protein